MKSRVMRHQGIIILTFLIIGLLGVRHAYATFELTVTPYEGGWDLRFGRVRDQQIRTDKELTVKITTDLGVQYRVIQTLLEPLTNVRGVTVPKTNFILYTRRGSNQRGTLGAETESPVSPRRAVLYTSDQLGEGDSFVVIYGLSVPEGQEPGLYRGRIAYTLEPVDATQRPQTVVIDVNAEVESVFGIEIKTTLAGKVLRLRSPEREELATQEVFIDITGRLGAQYRVVQLVTESLESAEAERLPLDKVLFSLGGGRKGVLGQAGQSPLSDRPTVIYTSTPGGDGDSIVVSFSLGDLTGQKAGRYRGSIGYFLESVSPYVREERPEIVQLEVEIEPIFDLSITTEAAGMVEFSGLRPGGRPKTSEVLIEVETNLGRPYQVVQVMPSRLVNQEGDIIPDEYFLMKVEDGESGGTIRLPSKTPVREGQTVLFTSNQKGDGDRFKIIYELTIPPDLPGGRYFTRVSCSLSEM